MLYKIVKTKFNIDTRNVDISNIKEGIVTKVALNHDYPQHDTEMKFAVSSLLKVDEVDITILDTMETKRGYIYAIRIGVN